MLMLGLLLAKQSNVIGRHIIGSTKP